MVGAYKDDSNQTSITNGTTASDDNSASDSGAAYVFIRSGTTWAQQAYLKAPNAQAGDGFGIIVSISGDTIVVSAYSEDSNQTSITNGTTASDNNSASESGAAYVFVRSGTTWAQQAYLKASNAEASDLLGTSSIAVSGNTIVVGARGESSNQTTITNGTTASNDNSASESGAAYVFVCAAAQPGPNRLILKPPMPKLMTSLASLSLSLWIPLWWVLCSKILARHRSLTAQLLVQIQVRPLPQVPPTSLRARATGAVFLQS